MYTINIIFQSLPYFPQCSPTLSITLSYLFYKMLLDSLSLFFLVAWVQFTAALFPCYVGCAICVLLSSTLFLQFLVLWPDYIWIHTSSFVKPLHLLDLSEAGVNKNVKLNSIAHLLMSTKLKVWPDTWLM